MDAPPYRQHYRLLMSQGLSPVAAAIALCRANKGNIEWIMRWLATKEPELEVFRERWMKYVQAENKDRAWLPGYLDEGCFFYSSLLRRPNHTVFIPWSEVDSIWIQDGLSCLALCLYSIPERHGCQHIQAESNMPGFEPFMHEIGRRFFGAPDYLESRFRSGNHPVRKLQVWPTDQSAEPGAAPNGGPAGQLGSSSAGSGPPSVS